MASDRKLASRCRLRHAHPAVATPADRDDGVTHHGTQPRCHGRRRTPEASSADIEASCRLGLVGADAYSAIVQTLAGSLQQVADPAVTARSGRTSDPSRSGAIAA